MRKLTFEWGHIQTCMLYMKKTHTFECLFLFATNIAIFGYNDQGRSKKLDENSILSPCSDDLDIFPVHSHEDLRRSVYSTKYSACIHPQNAVNLPHLMRWQSLRACTMVDKAVLS